MTDDDVSLQLIEISEQLDEIEDELLERGDDDARRASTICCEVSTICLELSEFVERTAAGSERFRIGDDDVLTDGGQVQACPDCDSAQITPRSGRNGAPRSGKDGAVDRNSWYCRACGASFEAPVIRDTYSPGGKASIPGNSLAGVLDGMDADEIGADGGRHAR